MIAADSSALVAILRREAEAERFESIISTADACLLSAVSLLETSMVIASDTGDSSVWMNLDALIDGLNIHVVAHDRVLAQLARDAFLRYGKGRHKAALNMGDCASYAVAKSRNLPLLFKGNDFAYTDLVSAA